MWLVLHEGYFIYWNTNEIVSWSKITFFSSMNLTSLQRHQSLWTPARIQHGQCKEFPKQIPVQGYFVGKISMDVKRYFKRVLVFSGQIQGGNLRVQQKFWPEEGFSITHCGQPPCRPPKWFQTWETRTPQERNDRKGGAHQHPD